MVIMKKYSFGLEQFISLKNRPFFFWFVLILFSIPVSWILINDVDIWWHMQTGKTYLETFAKPDFGTFYFTPLMEHKIGSLRFTWLGDILFYIIYLAGGDIGLQLFRMIIILGTCYLIISMGGGKVNGWKLMCLMFLIIGTYQTQLVRNALFSYLFVPILFYIWYQYKYLKKEKMIWFFPISLGIWGCLHGSYLLGLGLLLLIFAGDSIDLFIRRKRGRLPTKNSLKPVAMYFLILVLSFSINIIGNPQTKAYFTVDRLKSFLLLDETNSNNLPSQKSHTVSSTPEKEGQEFTDTYTTPGIEWSWHELKVKLNNTLFKTENAKTISGDFISPFDSLTRLYVKIALLFGLFGGIALCFFVRPMSLSLILPFIGGVILGCGYVRMVGYILLIVAPVLFISAGQGMLTINTKGHWGFWGSLVMLVLLYANYAMDFKIWIGGGLHAVGFGRIPTYSEKCADWVFKNYKDNKTFTTIANGGYLLFKWFPDKKVFMDGFFEPHAPVVKDAMYRLGELKENPDFLYKEFGVDNAILGLHEGHILQPFVQSANWYPVCIDRGQIVFVYSPEANDKNFVPEILEDTSDILNLPSVFRTLVARCIFFTADSLLVKGHIKDAHEFMNRYDPLVQEIVKYTPKGLVVNVNEKFANLVKDFGFINDRTLYYEELHNQAIMQENSDMIITNGLKVLKKYPARYPVIYNLAVAYFKSGRASETAGYLNRLKASRIMDPEYWESHRNQIALLYKKLFLLHKDYRLYANAYDCLYDSFLIDPNVTSEADLFSEGLNLYVELKNSGKEIAAFNLLRELHQALPDYGRILNAMAWHILTESHPEEENNVTARAYALQAAELMEKQKDTTLDMVYDTLAEVYFRLGNIDKMREYEEKAVEAAPPGRKNQYKSRNPR